MGRITALGVVILVVLAPLVVSGAGAGIPSVGRDVTPQSDSVAQRQQNSSGTAPGAQFVGVVAAHEEAHKGAVTERRVRLRFASVDSPLARAILLDAIFDSTQTRLDRLAIRRERLETALANGSISVSEYRARSAELTVELRSIERIAAVLELVAKNLSLSVLLEVDVDLEAIQSLEARADRLQGTALVRIAPSFAIAEDAVTTTSTTAGSVDETTNVSALLTNATETVKAARERVDEAEDTLAGLVISDETAALLDQAQYNLSQGEEYLSAAKTANAESGDERAVELARAAIDSAELAIEQAEKAIEAATT